VPPSSPLFFWILYSSAWKNKNLLLWTHLPHLYKRGRVVHSFSLFSYIYIGFWSLFDLSLFIELLLIVYLYTHSSSFSSQFLSIFSLFSRFFSWKIPFLHMVTRLLFFFFYCGSLLILWDVRFMWYLVLVFFGLFLSRFALFLGHVISWIYKQYLVFTYNLSLLFSFFHCTSCHHCCHHHFH
jgi:hypothetical protein